MLSRWELSHECTESSGPVSTFSGRDTTKGGKKWVVGQSFLSEWWVRVLWVSGGSEFSKESNVWRTDLPNSTSHRRFSDFFFLLLPNWQLRRRSREALRPYGRPCLWPETLQWLASGRRTGRRNTPCTLPEGTYRTKTRRDDTGPSWVCRRRRPVTRSSSSVSKATGPSSLLTLLYLSNCKWLYDRTTFLLSKSTILITY